VNPQIAFILVAIAMTPAAGVACSSDDTCAPAQACVRGSCRPYEAPKTICGLAKVRPADPMRLAPAESRAARIVRDIGRATGLENIPTVWSGPIDNAAAFMQFGERRIAYDPVFVDTITRTGKTGWETVFILAHEFGHHAEGHLFAGDCDREQELQADAFAARALRRLGATLEQTTAAMRVMEAQQSDCYPSSAARVARIIDAYHALDVLYGPYAPKSTDGLSPLAKQRPQIPYDFDDGTRQGYEKAAARSKALRPGMAESQWQAIMAGGADKVRRDKSVVDGQLCIAMDWGPPVRPTVLFGYVEREAVIIKFALVVDKNEQATTDADGFVLLRIEEDPPYRCGDFPGSLNAYRTD